MDEHAGPGRGQVGGRHSRPLPPARPGTALRVLATTDLAGTLVPIRTSYGEGGTCAGVVELLERERDRQPTVWLDAGDFTVGPTSPLLGERPWADMAALPITAAAAGNHEFDDGVSAMLKAARLLPYPLLCANVEVGLPPAAMVETGAGPLGVIGLTHPHVHRLSQAPPPAEDWPERVGPLARQLRSQGARWVAAILHDGVDWWPNPDPGGPPTRSRSQRLAALAAPWADQVDLIVGGHVPDAWRASWPGPRPATPMCSRPRWWSSTCPAMTGPGRRYGAGSRCRRSGPPAGRWRPGRSPPPHGSSARAVTPGSAAPAPDGTCPT